MGTHVAWESALDALGDESLDPLPTDIALDALSDSEVPATGLSLQMEAALDNVDDEQGEPADLDTTPAVSAHGIAAESSTYDSAVDPVGDAMEACAEPASISDDPDDTFLVPYLHASRRVPDDSSKLNSFFASRLQTMLDIDYNIIRSETASSAALDMDSKQLRELQICAAVVGLELESQCWNRFERALFSKAPQPMMKST